MQMAVSLPTNTATYAYSSRSKPALRPTAFIYLYKIVHVVQKKSRRLRSTDSNQAHHGCSRPSWLKALAVKSTAGRQQPT